MISWLKEKGQKIRAWAGEHPFLAATTIVAATLATGGVVYLAYRQFNGNEEIVFMDTLLDVVDPVSLTEPEFAVESPLIDMPETDEDFAYWLSYRREHLRDITPKCPSVQAREEAARHGVELPEHVTWVRASNPRIHCAQDDPRVILPPVSDSR